MPCGELGRGYVLYAGDARYIFREALMQILLAPITLAVGGTVAIVALLWLATFSWSDISTVGVFWLFLGISCALFSFVSPTVFFLLLMVAGLALVLLPSLMDPSNKKFRGWILYVVWVYFWIAAFIGWRHGWLGLLVITLPALLIAELGLFFVAGFLLPLPEQGLRRGGRPAPKPGDVPTFGQEIRDLFALIRYPENMDALKQCIEQRRKALRCLLTFTLGTNCSYYVVIDEKIAERTEETRTWLTEEEKLVKRVDGSGGKFLAGPGIVLTGCDQAVVLATSLKFKGAKGPGVVFTDRGDSPKHVIDLRVQLRAFPVEAWTKDGIAVKFFTSIVFQIGTGKEKPALGKGFPYRPSDVFKAVHAQLVEHVDPSQVAENLKQQAWYDLPEMAGKRLVREIISRYEFDQLYAPFELDRDPRSEIAKKLKEGKESEKESKEPEKGLTEKGLEKALSEWGIKLIGCGIGNIEPVDERVMEQRIEAWRADWVRKIMLKQAAGQSERLRLVEQARAQAQVDIILAVGKQIEQLRATGADTIAYYFIQVLIELAGQPILRRLLPGDTSDVLQRASGGLRESVSTEEK